MARNIYSPTRIKPEHPHPPHTTVRVGPRPRAPKKPVIRNPFAPTPDAQLRARAQAAGTAYSKPLLSSLQTGIEARSKAGTAAIGGLTEALGNLFAQYTPLMQQAYGQAESATQATNQSVANALTSQGAQNQAELNSKLAQINAPAGAGQAISGGPASIASGASAAGLARSSAALNALQAEGAHAGEYGAKLPGIAALTGQQNEANLQGQLNREYTTKAADITANAQTQAQSFYQHLVDQELQKALARASGAKDQATLNETRRYHNQQIAYKNQSDRRATRLKLAQLGISQQRVDEYARNNRVSAKIAEQRVLNQTIAEQEKSRHNRANETAKAAGVHRPNAALSAKYGYIVDANGKPILDKHGHKQKVAKTGRSTGGLPTGLGGG